MQWIARFWGNFQSGAETRDETIERRLAQLAGGMELPCMRPVPLFRR